MAAFGITALVILAILAALSALGDPKPEDQNEAKTPSVGAARAPGPRSNTTQTP